MIKPKRTAREIWNTLGLKQHIRQVFDDPENTSWGQIVESNRKPKPQQPSLVRQYQYSQTQRSISEYNVSQKLKEQHISFMMKKKDKNFLEDEISNIEVNNTATVKKNNIEEQKQEWKQLAIELSFIKQQTNNDQTFSPISRLKSKQQTDENIKETNKETSKENVKDDLPKMQKIAENSFQSVSNNKEVCKLQGHENNQIKFICTHNECPYKYHKACAHCVIKLHSKHVENMKEIDQFEHSLEDNMKKAQELVKKSGQLLKKIQFPYEQFFNDLKEALITVVDDIERRLITRNRERIQKLVKVELEHIQQFNSKFEAFQNNKKQNQQNLNLLLSDEQLEQYEITLNVGLDKLKTTFNIEELKTLVETNLISLMSEQQPKVEYQHSFHTPNQTSRTVILNSQRDQSPYQNRASSFHASQKLILSPRSPLNVFNHNINVSRQIPKLIQNNPQIVYYRSNN